MRFVCDTVCVFNTINMFFTSVGNILFPKNEIKEVEITGNQKDTGSQTDNLLNSTNTKKISDKFVIVNSGKENTEENGAISKDYDILESKIHMEKN